MEQKEGAKLLLSLLSPLLLLSSFLLPLVIVVIIIIATQYSSAARVKRVQKIPNSLFHNLRTPVSVTSSFPPSSYSSSLSLVHPVSGRHSRSDDLRFGDWSIRQDALHNVMQWHSNRIALAWLWLTLPPMLPAFLFRQTKLSNDKIRILMLSISHFSAAKLLSSLVSVPSTF